MTNLNKIPSVFRELRKEDFSASEFEVVCFYVVGIFVFTQVFVFTQGHTLFESLHPKILGLSRYPRIQVKFWIILIAKGAITPNLRTTAISARRQCLPGGKRLIKPEN